MGLIDRLRKWGRSIFGTGDDKHVPAQPPAPKKRQTGLPSMGEEEARRWKIESLHYGKRRPPILVQGWNVDDQEVAEADAIRVSYTFPNGVTMYRTVHGAQSKQRLMDLIDTETRVNSPF